MPKPSLPALDPADVEVRTSTLYPPPHDAVTRGRAKRVLTKALGLTQFGVNVTELAPGAASALRHWHSREDEFVYVLEGEVTLVTDEGEQRLGAGQCAGFPAGATNGHCLRNDGSQPVRFLEVGSRDPRDEVSYPDVDLHCQPGRYDKPVFTRKGGGPIGERS
jgi:uncharacterized cupin superfamily protein